ncbi:hypothetical protein BH09MYX1_BH09MYX1_03640 [soil metagenome]
MRAPLDIFSAASFVIATAIVSAGCGGGAAPRPKVSVSPPSASASAATTDTQPALDTDAIVTAVARVRGLPPKTPIAFSVVDETTFATSFRAEIDRRRKVRGTTASSISGTADPSYYLAYYDTGSHKVLLRDQTPEWAKLQDVRELVAHEVEHAIQDQYFDLDKLLAEPETDVERAHLALAEGDAQAVAAGAVAFLDHLPPKRAIVRGTALADGVGVDTYVAGGLVDPRIGALKPAEREEMLFPYRYGASFVGALVRVGGFALVDKAFARPPRSSAEIIHPQAYLDGRVRREVKPLPDPAGWSAVGVKGAVGELALRKVLTSFALPPDRIRALSEAWRGDSFVTLHKDGSAPAYAWAIVVADEGNAILLATILGAHGRVRQSGVVLAYTEALPDAVAEGVIPTLMTLPDPSVKAPVPPFGALVISPAPPRIEDRDDLRGATKDGIFRDPKLGLKLTIPRDFVPRPLDQKPGILALFSVPSGAVVLSVDSMRPTPIIVRAMVGGVISGMKDQGVPSRREEKHTMTAFGTMPEAWVQYDTTGALLRFMAIPICKREASMMVTFLQRPETPATTAMVEQWLLTLDVAAIEASPYCADVAQERVTDLP